MSNIRSLSDLRKNDKKRKDRISNYTGGQKSGLEVENSDDDVDNFISSKLIENCRKVTLYKNGFTIDNGEFRDLEIQENKKFLEDIQAGIVPKELAGKEKTVNVALRDKSKQLYIEESNEKNKDFRVYQGEGKKLGGDNNINEDEIKKLNSLPSEINDINIDQNKSITTLQIRFYNGKKITKRFNYDNTVEDLFQYIYEITPINFSLLYDFPPKEIKRCEDTLEKSKLIDITITQKKN